VSKDTTKEPYREISSQTDT